MGACRLIEKLPSTTLELEYLPSFIQKEYNCRDSFCEYDHFAEKETGVVSYGGPVEFTSANQEVLRNVMMSLPNKDLHIVEIGIARNEQSSTKVILDLKNQEDRYLGIDIRDGSFLRNEAKNIYTAQGFSLDEKIIREVRRFSKGQIDLLMIDGDHSIDTVTKEVARYFPMVPIGGYIVMHDVSHHPGPREVFKAVSPKYFEKVIYCPNDYGIGVLKRIC